MRHRLGRRPLLFRQPARVSTGRGPTSREITRSTEGRPLSLVKPPWVLTMESTGASVSEDQYSETIPLLGGQRRASRVVTAGRRLVKGVNDGVGFAMSKKGKMVLKCSFAYFLGSLATSVVLRN